MAISNSQKLVSSLSSSRSIKRHFQWPTTSNKVSNSQEADDQTTTTTTTTTRKSSQESQSSSKGKKKANQGVGVAVLRFRKAITSLRQNNKHQQECKLGHKVIGTLFGNRRGTVNFVLQREHKSTPVFFVELATSITTLVNEMASGGLVRIALECSREQQNQKQQQSQKQQQKLLLLDEPVWRAYCNGKQCGFAKRKEIGPTEAKILKMVEPISMGAGMLAGFNGSGNGAEGELMYMRSKFERVVGSRDSEAFYMMNPDCNSAPELSVYLLRV